MLLKGSSIMKNTYSDFMWVHGVVGVSTEQVDGQWVTLAELGGEQHGGDSK